MTSLSLSNIFDQLEDAKSKIQALDELVDKLSHNEVRFLQAKIGTVDFRSDPIDKLPFELCYHIFQHLEIYQIFQVQRVSRKWYQFLSSPKIVEPLALRPWFRNSEMASRTSKGFLQGELAIPKGLSPGGEASLQARHVDSFRNGTAFSMARGKCQSRGRNTDLLCHIDFAGSILARTDRQVGCIRLECLISGQGVCLFTPMREEIRQIAISDTTLVAMTLSGKCCDWDLSGGIRNMEGQSPGCIETHVDEEQIVFVHEETVVALHRDSDEMMNFTIWDIKCRQSHRFRMQINQGLIPKMYSYFVLTISGGQYIVFFERVFDMSKYVRFTRTNLKGQIESSGYMEHPDIKGYSRHSEKATPVYTADCVTLWSYAGSRGGLDAQQTESNTWDIMRVVYDTKADRLELQRYAVEHSIQTEFDAGDFLWWKDVAYFANCADGREDIEVLDLEASVCKEAEMSPSDLVLGTLEPPSDDEEIDLFGSLWGIGHFLLGNESFLICVRSGYYTAWCFENIKLAGEDPEYRAMMTRKKKERLEGRKRKGR